MRILKNEGFTLVELMVVVAIVGILSSVAIPNFKKYQAKSKSAEARLQLASIYSAETAIQSDYDTFATCLVDAGYSVPSNNYYAYGFAAANTTVDGNVNTNGGSAICNSVAANLPARPANSFSFPAAASRRVANNLATVANLAAQCPTCTIPNSGATFIAGALGNISPDITAVAAWDRWTINENKVLLHPIIGY